MDPDMEFNALAALTQSVIHDMKQSYPAWELVSQRAVKLSQQLRNTAQCFTSFCDAVQSVSDHASNLKGATRDVGACVTRVCMRQRALESRFRTFADAFSEQLARGLAERTNYWKQRTSDLDKNAIKHIKKVRSRKRRPDPQCMSEQRQICTQMLGEQREQFSFFINMLMPVLKAELTVLDEGPHIRQAIDTLEQTVECVDSAILIDTIVSDVTQGVDGAWQKCLDDATLRFREKSIAGSELDLTPIARPSSLNVSESGHIEGDYVLASKPPRRPVTRSNSKASCISPLLNNSPLSDSIYNMSQYAPGRLGRPHSINGETYPQQAGNSSYCSSEASAAINETLHQIDQLGSDLENFCTTSFDMRYNPDHSATSSSFNGSGSIRARSESLKPPPPARRNSQIQAATPTAPSIVDARNYMMGSRQSLNSSLFSGSTSDLNHQHHHSLHNNVNPYVKHSTFTPNYNL